MQCAGRRDRDAEIGDDRYAAFLDQSHQRENIEGDNASLELHDDAYARAALVGAPRGNRHEDGERV